MIQSIMKYKTKKDAFILILTAITFFGLGWLICYQYNQQHQTFLSYTKPDYIIPSQSIQVTSSNIDQISLTIPKTKEESAMKVENLLDMELERIVNKFEKTMRSCLGLKCFDESVNGVDRIGLLAPLKSGGEVLLKTLQSRVSNNKISIIYDTHVPAYGYGKNHGWSRIIRIARPIIPHSLDLVGNSPSSTLLEAQLKQLMRWHCRLSHVAAHTKLLTIFTTDLLSRPMVEIEKMLTFIGTNYDRHALIADDSKLYQELGKELSDIIVNDIHYDVSAIAKYVIDLELNSTKFLTKWPCPSFKGLEKDYKMISLPMKSSQLSANCSDPMVTCSVHYDQNGG